MEIHRVQQKIANSGMRLSGTPLLLLFSSVIACGDPSLLDSDTPLDDAHLAGGIAAPSTTLPLLGVYQWERVNHPSNMEFFGQWLGREPQLAVAFSPHATWDDLDGTDWQLNSWAPWVNAKPGRNLVLQFGLLPGPVDRSGPDGILGTADDVSLQKCAAGVYDQYWRNLANTLVAKQLSRIYLRPGHEFDGDWYAWRAAGNETAYAGCFKRVVQTMRAAQPTSGWRFVWNLVGADKVNTTFLNATWPGDAYVDNVGIDLYDQSWLPNTYPYPTVCDSACRQARQNAAWAGELAHINQIRDFARLHGKPISFPEWGAGTRPDGHGGGDDPAYIQRMRDYMAVSAGNNVEFQAYFDVQADIQCQISDAADNGVDRSYVTLLPQSAKLYRSLFITY